MSAEPTYAPERLSRARLSLDGLSVGDAFGQQMFYPGPLVDPARIARGEVPAGAWRYTDDTEMALGIMEVLLRHGHIDQEDLADTFARRYAADDRRGYGSGAHFILDRIGRGEPWQVVSAGVFDGRGSMGNGGAMRVGPLGAWFAEDDPATVTQQARLSAEVTHAHPEGQAGAIAIATAAAFAWRHRGPAHDPAARANALFDFVLAHAPPGETRDGIERVRAFPLSTEPLRVAEAVGNGTRVTAPDTVPFALWCAARHLDSFTDAMWTTVSVAGDIDTNCAIVGGVVALSAPPPAVPETWLRAREPLGIDLPA